MIATRPLIQQPPALRTNLGDLTHYLLRRLVFPLPLLSRLPRGLLILPARLVFVKRNLAHHTMSVPALVARENVAVFLRVEEACPVAVGPGTRAILLVTLAAGSGRFVQPSDIMVSSCAHSLPLGGLDTYFNHVAFDALVLISS